MKSNDKSLATRQTRYIDILQQNLLMYNMLRAKAFREIRWTLNHGFTKEAITQMRLFESYNNTYKVYKDDLSNYQRMYL